MNEGLARLRRDLGRSGLAGVALAAAALGFSLFVVQPREEENLRLAERVAQAAREAEAPDTGVDKVRAVYRFLARDEQTTDWLAKLHGIATATGVQLKSASYRSLATDTPIRRYEIVLPVEASYPQIRDFLKRAAADIPVLSVDSLTLKRESAASGALQAELRLTLHMVKS